MSRLLVAQRALTVPGWAKDALWRRAQAIPSLDLRFADNKSLTDAVTGSSLVTFTRASSGTFVGSDGLIATASNDAPRFDHNPATGESLGLLVEEARTNSIRNNTMVGAVAGTPGTLPTNWVQSIAAGLTRQIVATGTVNGIDYIEIRISGTTADTVGWSLGFDANTSVAASSGQAWTTSMYVAVVGGSTANMTSTTIRVVERGAAGVYITESGSSWGAAPSTLTPASRFSATRPSMGASTQFVSSNIYFNAISGVAIDITLRIGLPQLEQGAFATSPIPTTTAAVTRSADVASITGSAFSSWYSQSEGTVFWEAALAPGNPPASTFPGYWSLNNGTATNAIMGYAVSSTVNRLFVRESGTVTADISFPAFTAAATSKSAGAYKVNDAAGTTNGGTIGTDSSVTLPTPDRLTIGAQALGSPLNGYLRRLTYWPVRLGNNVLQQVTR